MALFNDTDFFNHGEPRTQAFELPDASFTLYEHFFSKEESDNFYDNLRTGIQWQQEEITLYGKTHLTPRLTAWYGDADKIYTYSGIRHQPLTWTKDLQQIKQTIEHAAGAHFNSVLLNYYRNGRDSMGWHRDDEKELGKNPVIGSVSFGETRPFKLRHKFRKDVAQVELLLKHGSFLLMAGSTQHYWEHAVPKTAKPIKPRINLTFRNIK